ncbi:hypothetical protein NIES4075_12090 [Tolypothrix sp. NIES-4075]|uniref:hypothetical protein n=1 Tax=Tolypothrix sp. NIES-4075 TaxID=2005459 RepID=UPI000B6A05C1|nr:hypothetical protein [Tolypothrix sp. NIES-4075]GAX40246.1 hypothetical protein NIES4075_12090 [Tolypothrix sp. NIES-4075]
MGNGEWGMGNGKKCVTNYPTGSPVARLSGDLQSIALANQLPIRNYQLSIPQSLI